MTIIEPADAEILALAREQRTTEEQERAIKAIYDRGPIFKGDLTAPQLAMEAGWTFHNFSTLPPEKYSGDWFWTHPEKEIRFREADQIVVAFNLAEPMTFRQFRKTVITGFDCLMVRWAGMVLGVEPDGYVHS